MRLAEALEMGIVSILSIASSVFFEQATKAVVSVLVQCQEEAVEKRVKDNKGKLNSGKLELRRCSSLR